MKMLLMLMLVACALAQPCVINDPVDPREMHAEIRAKVIDIFNRDRTDAGIFMNGNDGVVQEYSLFRQDPYFTYLTGAMEEELSVFIHLETGHTTLFVPYRDENWQVWNGVGRTNDEIRVQYGVDRVEYNHDMAQTLATLNVSTIYTFPETTFDGEEDYDVDKGNTLRDVLRAGRTIKTEKERSTMKMTTHIAAEAHAAYLKAIVPGWTEYQAESLFLHVSYNCGCRFQSYTPIFGCGSNGAVLHYSANSDLTKDGDIFLVDAGPEYRGYATDVTRTFPVNGVYTQAQLNIYNIVLEAQQTCMDMVRPGASWGAISDNAKRVILQGLLDIGLIHGGTIEQLLAAGIDRLFYMHSLGHMIGLQVHDVEGYLLRPQSANKIVVPDYELEDPMLRHLRGEVMDINILEEGMVFTIEPGIYFNPVLLEPAFDTPSQAQYLNETAIRAYFSFGGVRIEDVIGCVADGYENYSEELPRLPHEIEALMASGKEGRVPVALA